MRREDFPHLGSLRCIPKNAVEEINQFSSKIILTLELGLKSKILQSLFE